MSNIPGPLTTQNTADVYQLTSNVFMVTAMQGYINLQALDCLDSPAGPQYGTIELNGTNIDLQSGGLASLSLCGQEESGGVQISTSGLTSAISLSSNSEGLSSTALFNSAGILLAFNLPGISAQVALNEEALSLSMGPPGAGSKILMTEESIVFQVGETIMTITAEGVVTEAPTVEVSCEDTNISISAEGINEEVGEVTREMNAEGHNFTAAETELNVGVEGIACEAPTQELEFEAASELSATENSITGDAMLSQEAAITMTE